MEFHIAALFSYWPKCINADEKSKLVKWFLDGDLLGFDRKDLESVLSEHEELQETLSKLDPNDVSCGRHPPEFRSGDSVEVIVNAKNLTYHMGTVRKEVWHLKDRRWNFYLEANGKKIGKRYLANDLRKTSH